MCINQGSIAQKNLTRTSDWKSKEVRGLNEKNQDLIERVLCGGRAGM
jgi:hypothetical protein